MAARDGYNVLHKSTEKYRQWQKNNSHSQIKLVCPKCSTRYGNIILDLSWSWINDKSRLIPGRIYRQISVLDQGRPDSRTEFPSWIQDVLYFEINFCLCHSCEFAAMCNLSHSAMCKNVLTVKHAV